MNRPIKFRAYIEEPGGKPQMVSDVGLIPEGERRDNYPMNISSTGIYVNPFCEWIHLMQYTGLKDRNGQEVYEGDIVKGGAEYVPGCVGQIVHQGMAFVIKGRMGDGRGWIDTRTSEGATEMDVEVIGNRFENPELLEES